MSPVGVGISSRSNLRLGHALQTGQAKLWILLVGVNQYQDDNLSSLQYCAPDCRGLAEALTQATWAFPNKEILIYHDFAAQSPWLATVRAGLKQIVSQAQPQDTVLFYFSGHGILEPESRQAFLCFTDTQKDDLLTTGLSLPEVLQQLGECPAQQQLVWLDACHSGGMTLRGVRGAMDTSLPDPTTQLLSVLRLRAAQSKGFYALLSCDQNQRSWEFPELGHGVFTYHLMRGLRGEAADAQGVIGVDALYRYVYHQTLQHIDKTNQQLRLINQQKRGRGESDFQAEYPLQTPKRIVEGVGELIIGLKPQGIARGGLRRALVIDGLAGTQALTLGKMMRAAGGFEVGYWPRPGRNWSEVREAIRTCLGSDIPPELQSQAPTPSRRTVFLYLRGWIDETEEGETWLVLGDGVRLSRSWLRQELHRARTAQQIVVLDCPGARSLGDWVEGLRLGLEQGQCLLAAAAPAGESDYFTRALLETLEATDPQVGLPVAGWISALQVYLAGTGINLHVWLSGAQGVIEVLPGNVGSASADEGLDLGLCPYMGLRAFAEEDAQYFYGRASLTQELVCALSGQALLAVVGASGSGKSSLVQAGLLARLRQGSQLPGSAGWWMRSFRPGAQPIAALARRLVDVGSEREKAYQQMQLEGMLHMGVEGFVQWLRARPEPVVVLVVDQFEELFTLASSQERQLFLDIVLGATRYAADRFKLVVTLRVDFMANALEIPDLAGVLKQSSVLVPSRLTEEDYRQVIIKPAERVGLEVDPELVEVLLQELSHSAGDLPLLEFVLEQLWESRYGGRLTLQAYQQQIGGLKGALERKAQAVYESLDEPARDCAKWIFLSLTQLGEGTEDTRRRVRRSELVVAKYPPELVERTLLALTAAKLAVVGIEADEAPGAEARSRGEGAHEESDLEKLEREVTVEVAHEALIRHWSTLRWWLEENRARLRVQRQIEEAAELWQQKGQQADFLLRGVRLAEAEEIYVKYTDELPQEVQQFIAACLDERRSQQLGEKKRLKQARGIAGIMSILAVLAVGFGGLAYLQIQKSQQSEVQALNSSSEGLLLTNQQLEALVASVKAGKLVQRMISGDQALRVQTESQLQQVLSTVRESNRLEGHGGAVLGVSFSPDSQMIASASYDNTVRLWKRDGTLFKILTGHSQPVNGVSFSPDGRMVASADWGGTIRLWNQEGKLLKVIPAHTLAVLEISFSPDGKLLASASRDRTIKLWNSNGELLSTLRGHDDAVSDVCFSPDGQTIASASADKTVKLWNREGKLLKNLQGHSDKVLGVSFSPDGKIVASAGRDKTVRFWTRDGALLNTLTGHSNGVSGVGFSRDGKTITSTSWDGTLKLWSQDGFLLKTLNADKDEINNLSFSPDGQLLVTAGGGGIVKLWHVDNTLLLHTLSGHTAGGVTGVHLSSDGQTVTSASWDGTLKLWRRDGKLLRTIAGHQGNILSVRFSPDEQIFASAGWNGTIKLWSREGTLLKTFSDGHDQPISDISFSPNGQTIVSSGWDGAIKIWSVDGRLLKTFRGHSSEVYGVSFSPNGQTIVSGDWDGAIKIWSVDGRLLKTFRGHSIGVYSVSFSPDGKIIASASHDKTVKLWTLNGTLLRTLRGHTSRVHGVSFSPDGRILASASGDKTIRLWGLDGTLLKIFTGHDSPLHGINFSPDGKVLGFGGTNNTVLLWDWNHEVDELVVRGCSWLRNYLKTSSNLNESDQRLCNDVQ